MSDSYDPEIVMLPSPENQVKIFYDRIAEVQPGPLQMPDYVISDSERFSEVLGVLDGRTGSGELRVYGEEGYDVFDSSEDIDLAEYVDRNLSATYEQGERRRIVEGIGSFEVDLPDGDFLTGYVMTGREHFPDELPEPIMAEIQVFADPRRESEVVIKLSDSRPEH